MREVKEETGLEAEAAGDDCMNPFGVYDSPRRDPRGRVVSIVYVCKAVDGSLEAGSDARDTKVLALDKAMEENLKFDHSRIVEKFAHRQDF